MSLLRGGSRYLESGGAVAVSKELTNHMLFCWGHAFCKILKSETELKTLTQLTLMTALYIELF